MDDRDHSITKDLMSRTTYTVTEQGDAHKKNERESLLILAVWCCPRLPRCVAPTAAGPHAPSAPKALQSRRGGRWTWHPLSTSPHSRWVWRCFSRPWWLCLLLRKLSGTQLPPTVTLYPLAQRERAPPPQLRHHMVFSLRYRRLAVGAGAVRPRAIPYFHGHHQPRRRRRMGMTRRLLQRKAQKRALPVPILCLVVPTAQRQLQQVARTVAVGAPTARQRLRRVVREVVVAAHTALLQLARPEGAAAGAPAAQRRRWRRTACQVTAVALFVRRQPARPVPVASATVVHRRWHRTANQAPAPVLSAWRQPRSLAAERQERVPLVLRAPTVMWQACLLTVAVDAAAATIRAAPVVL